MLTLRMSRDFSSVLVVKKKKKNLPALQDLSVWSQGQEDPLEKEMATTPVFLTREFHGQRSLVVYSPWGHKRVRNDLVTKQPQQMMSGMEPWRTVSP